MDSPPLSATPPSIPRDEHEERAFFQARLARFFRLGFILSGIFVVLALLTFVISRSLERWRPDSAAFQASTAVFCWVAFQLLRLRKWSTAWLQAFDFVGMVFFSLAAIAQSAHVAAYLRPEIFQILCVTQLLALRAAMIPSSAARSAMVGSAAVLPVSAYAHWFYTRHSAAPDAPTPLFYAAFVLLMGAASVVVATVISHVLYGLRRKVREATQLGQYTLEEKIGEGGMGVVYKAHHAMLRRPTAVKLLPPERASERDIIRFEREVQLTAALTHPNTIAIYDYGRTQDGVFYYAMEYLDGVDLEVLVERNGPQPAGRIIHVLLQVCSSLREAHGVGLIHRDIKPANIVLCERGGASDVVKVVDFGLVKSVAQNDAAPGVSRVDHIVGTPLYLAPEAIVDPGAVTAQSDVYAMGAVGYFLLCGAPVFSARTVVELCAHHLHSVPAHPRDVLGKPVADDLSRVFLSCLEKDPGRRPSGAAGLAEALASCADANAWTTAEAHDWWNTVGRAMKTLREESIAVAPTRRASPLRTLTLALQGRFPHAGLDDRT